MVAMIDKIFDEDERFSLSELALGMEMEGGIFSLESRGQYFHIPVHSYEKKTNHMNSSNKPLVSLGLRKQDFSQEMILAFCRP